MIYFIKKLYTNILPAFVLDRNKRKSLRVQLKAKHLKPNMKKMKLGVSYSVWDGEELLEASLKNIRSEVDYINVVWQKESWFGKKCNKNLESFLKKLKEKGLIDEIILFPHRGITNSPPRVERRKRNLGLEAVKKAGCNYFLAIDTDEFYKKEEFKKAKELIVERNISYTACAIISYWKKPEYRKSLPDLFSVPFICKINTDSKLIRNSHFPCFADGTREINITKKDKFLYLNTVIMHHMSLVRKDIDKKYSNASIMTDNAKKSLIEKYEKLNDKTLDKYDFVKTKNIFGIKV